MKTELHYTTMRKIRVATLRCLRAVDVAKMGDPGQGTVLRILTDLQDSCPVEEADLAFAFRRCRIADLPEDLCTPEVAQWARDL